MILTGDEIRRAVANGSIGISEFDEKRLNPNSYNLRIANSLWTYDTNGPLDMKKPCQLVEHVIPEEGFVLQPGVLYLSRTMEYTETYGYVPMLEGRSSLARLGVQVHLSAGFGDIGFCGRWTLELSCVQPVRIYGGTEVCQIYYVQHWGDASIEYNGKYQNAIGVQGSHMWEEFCKMNGEPKTLVWVDEEASLIEPGGTPVPSSHYCSKESICEEEALLVYKEFLRDGEPKEDGQVSQGHVKRLNIGYTGKGSGPAWLINSWGKVRFLPDGWEGDQQEKWKLFGAKLGVQDGEQ